MKKITKFFSALLALLAVGLITVSLVACSAAMIRKLKQILEKTIQIQKPNSLHINETLQPVTEIQKQNS